MKITKEMEVYAKEQMINLIQNISHQPIECYSQKVSIGNRGQEKQYFLGRTYVENLINQIKSS